MNGCTMRFVSSLARARIRSARVCVCVFVGLCGLGSRLGLELAMELAMKLGLALERELELKLGIGNCSEIS